MATLVAFGDSITSGEGASDQAHRYIELVAAAKSWTLTNKGVSGARLNDPGVIDEIYATAVTDTENYSVLIGTNNMHLNNADANYQDSFRSNLMAGLAWLSIPDGNKQKAINRSSETGTWTTNASNIYGGMGKKSTTNNSTMTFEAHGSTVYVGYIRTTSGAGTFTVMVDGQLKANVPTIGSVPARSDSLGSHGAGLIRIPNLMNVSHTVTITVTSPTNANNTVFIDWVGGNGQLDTLEGPHVYCGNVILGNSYGTTGGSNVAVGQYNSAIRDVTTSLAKDGLLVKHVDCINAVDINTDLDADGIHPNDAGHANIASSFLAHIDGDLVNEFNTQWRSPSLQNGWVNYGGVWTGAEYMKDSTGVVHVHGMVKNGTIGSVPIFNLPQGFRPSATISFPVRTGNAFGFVEIYNNGDVNAQSGNNGHFSLDSIQFMAEQ